MNPGLAEIPSCMIVNVVVLMHRQEQYYPLPFTGGEPTSDTAD